MIMSNGCFDSNEYINYLIDDDGKCTNEFMLLHLDLIREKYGLNNLWDYPLNEIEHIIENNIPVVLVRFLDLYGGYEYRWCEVYE